MIIKYKQMMINNSTVNDRILYLIDNQYDGNKKKFSESIGFSAQVISNIVSGRLSKPSFDVINAIVSTNVDLNIEWLVTGQGEMLKSSTIENNLIVPDNKYGTKSLEKTYDEQNIPMFNAFATASVISLFKDTNSLEIVDTISIPNMTKCDGAIPIIGDSMYPLLKAGDLILYKTVHDLQLLLYGNMYLIAINMDGDELLMVKYIHKSSKHDYIKLVSENRHHDDLEVHTKHIISLAIIKGSIRYNFMR